MLIDRTGFYKTNGREEARVFGLRGDNCIGYVIHADGKSVAAVWHSKDGMRINGPADESLVGFVRETPARISPCYLESRRILRPVASLDIAAH